MNLLRSRSDEQPRAARIAQAAQAAPFVDRGLILHRMKLHAGRLAQPISPPRLGVIASVRTSAPDFVMTYDDGPHPRMTAAILDVLARWDARAVFFMLVGNARAHPDCVRAIRAGGHEVGLHGLDHETILIGSADEVRAKLVAGKAELEGLADQAVRWYRPPYGLIDRRGHRLVRELGMLPVHWNRTAWDWNPTSPGRRYRVATLSPRRGNIILQHDVPNNADPGKSEAEAIASRAELSSRILAGYAAHGLRSRTLTEATSSGPPSYRFHLSWSAKTATNPRMP